MMQNYRAWVGFGLVAAGFAFVGIVGTFFPQQLQDWYIRYYEQRPWLMNLNPFTRYMYSPWLVAGNRAVGVFALAVLGLLLYAVLVAARR